MKRIVDIMATLRAPDGCPWDREQTPESLKRYIIEEAYEVCDAIDSGESGPLCEELGDLLLQVVFQAQIAKEHGLFDIDDVVNAISDKMEHRHPHVFGDEHVTSADEVHKLWEKRKAEEKKDRGLLDGIPKSLPALSRAQSISEKAATVGFDWPTIDGPLAKVEEELAELHDARAANNKDAIEDEFGDVLFALVNLARFLKINPENALSGTINKFTARFRYVEGELAKEGLTTQTATLEQMEMHWNAAKKKV